MKKEIPEATNIGGIRILTVRDVAEILNISIPLLFHQKMFNSRSIRSVVAMVFVLGGSIFFGEYILGNKALYLVEFTVLIDLIQYWQEVHERRCKKTIFTHKNIEPGPPLNPAVARVRIYISILVKKVKMKALLA